MTIATQKMAMGQKRQCHKKINEEQKRQYYKMYNKTKKTDKATKSPKVRKRAQKDDQMSKRTPQ